MSDPLQATPPPIASGLPSIARCWTEPSSGPAPMCKARAWRARRCCWISSTGRYYTLNRLGSVIWEHCTGHSTISDIHAVLCDRFEVSPDRALDDLVALVNQLVQEGLLQQERR